MCNKQTTTSFKYIGVWCIYLDPVLPNSSYFLFFSLLYNVSLSFSNIICWQAIRFVHTHTHHISPRHHHYLYTYYTYILYIYIIIITCCYMYSRRWVFDIVFLSPFWKCSTSFLLLLLPTVGSNDNRTNNAGYVWVCVKLFVRLFVLRHSQGDIHNAISL
jgi:hypothetical protein